jgi:hypothetical protein
VNATRRDEEHRQLAQPHDVHSQPGFAEFRAGADAQSTLSKRILELSEEGGGGRRGKVGLRRVEGLVGPEMMALLAPLILPSKTGKSCATRKSLGSHHNVITANHNVIITANDNQKAPQIS